MDWNNDGRTDLLVGHRNGNIRIYLNSGTNAAPTFTTYSNLQVGGTTFDCGLTATPYIVDWNNDGKKDVLCGEDNGGVFLLLNTGTDANPTFTSSTMIAGVSVGGDGGRASPVAFDWDRDGKKDLLVGNTNGTIRFFGNAGTDASPVFSTSSLLIAGGSTLDVYLYSRFDVIDWNNDTVPDIVCGGYYGKVWVFLGTGPAPRTNISGTVWFDADKDGQRDPGEPGMAGVTVFLDDDGDGQYDPPGTQTFTSADVPQSIVDYQSVVSSLSVPAGLGAVLDLNVTLSIIHTFDADVEVLLTSPAGTGIRLFAGVGASGNNFTGTTLDDEADAPISSGVAPFSGSYKPLELLSAFDGQVASGTWTLTVKDRASGDQGELTAWSLAIQTGETFRQTEADGSFMFADVSPGTYSVWQAVPMGYVQSFPAGGHDFQLDPGQSYSDANFGNRMLDSTPPEIIAWSSAATHGIVGEALLTIPDDGTFSEPRNTGIRRLVVGFSKPIAATSFSPLSVQVVGQDVNGNDVDLSGITIITSTRNGDTEGVIEFSQALPNIASYVVQIQGVTDMAGSPLVGDTDRIMTALVGDATCDGVVNAGDYIALKRELGSSVSLANASIDFDCSGMVDCGDLMALQGCFGQSIGMGLSAPEQVEASATAVTTSGLSVGLPAASFALVPTAGVVDALAHSGPSRLAPTLSVARPSHAEPRTRLARRLGPWSAPSATLLSPDTPGPAVADVLQLARLRWRGDSATRELPDEPWMTSLDMDIAGLAALRSDCLTILSTSTGIAGE